MSKFNKTTPGAKTATTNLAGGDAYAQSPELELISILLTSFADDSFYRKETNTFNRLNALLAKVNPEFAAKAAVYARNEFGMRSITHVLSSEIAKYISGKSWAKDFYTAVVKRPDDMTEIFSYHLAHNGKETNAMRKGFGKAFAKFSGQSLAKYKGNSKDFKLVDVVKLVHPPRSEKNAAAIAELIAGTLKSADTWEANMTKAGQNAKNDQEKEAFKKDVWVKLLNENKLKYIALIRNLRNIIQQAPEVLPLALTKLQDERSIRKSLVFPFSFMTAYDEISKLPSSKEVRDTMVALSTAIDISLKNVPVFDGETVVVLDTSGSMGENHAQLGMKTPFVIGALFSAALLKSNRCDFLTFDASARYINLNPLDSTMTLAKSIRFDGNDTNFHSIFYALNKKYDRIIILSDMQGWVGGRAPKAAFSEYKTKFNANPKVYSFDLKNYGTMQFAEQNVFAIAGYSDKVFDLMQKMEQDKNALLNTIKSLKFEDYFAGGEKKDKFVAQ